MMVQRGHCASYSELNEVPPMGAMEGSWERVVFCWLVFGNRSGCVRDAEPRFFVPKSACQSVSLRNALGR